MSKPIKTEKNLINALKREQYLIIIEGDLVKKIREVQVFSPSGTVLDVAGIGAIGAGIAGAVVGMASEFALDKFHTMTLKSRIFAVIADETGSTDALEKLRQYKVSQKSYNRLVLKLK